MYTNIHIYTNTNDLQKKEELRPGVDPHQDCFLMYTNIHISTITNNLQKKKNRDLELPLPKIVPLSQLSLHQGLEFAWLFR